ncbi:LuxR family transcriptional regulator [Reticulibacter mediterranei]|uniref:LuxR family transcriptional regulator n=2 Tax=Reticulibacter mediterranei TaxID=2778369 RepID=A0A8J3IAM5_9CHLR|nr:LuxR family transcriptional regulator [Reticulibacter mediterranei]
MLTLLQAPAGFGKTTLVAQWIASRHADPTFPAVSWISLEASDNDPQRFWRYLVTACQTQQKPMGKDVLAQLSSPLPSPFMMPPLDTILLSLLNDLALLQHPGLLVLDNYHVIEDPAIHQTLIFFLDHLPTMFHVLLLTRAEPPFPLLRWRARGVLAELHTADLRFSPEETATFVCQAVPVSLSQATLSQLDTSLEGWAAGLRLLCLTLQRQRSMQEVEASLHSLSAHSGFPVPQALLDYLVTEILHAQPEALQRFLLQTSQLTYLNGSLCDAVTGRTDSTALLASLERTGLFLETVDEAGALGPWYRSHAFWSEALRREAYHMLGEERLRTLTRRSSSWYEQHAMLAEAIDAALLAGDPSHAAVLIDRSMTDGAAWDPPTLLRWLSCLPDEILSTHPGLSLLFVLLLRFPQGRDDLSLPEETWERIEVILQMTQQEWRGQSNLTWLGELYAIRALSVLSQDPFRSAVKYAQQALTWLPKGESDDEEIKRPEIRAWRGVSLFILGLEDFHQGHFGEAKPVIEEAYTCSLTIDDSHFTRETLLLLGECCAARGELHQAAEYYRQTLASTHQQEDHEHRASALIGLAQLSFEWNDLRAAKHQVHKALELVRNREQRLCDQAALQIALLCHAQGETTSAQQHLATLLAHRPTASTPWTFWLHGDILSWQTRLHLVTGDLQGAQHGLEWLSRHEQKLAGEQQVKAKILQARLLLAQGKRKEARYQLERCLLAAKAQWQRRNTLEIQLLLALTHAAEHQKQEAKQWLTQALTQAQGEGFLRLFLWEGDPLVRLLVSILPEKGLRSYVESILHAFARSKGQDAADAALFNELLAPLLSPQERRVLELLLSGCSNAQIAQELVVSVNTVKHHVKHVYRKLGVSNRLEASSAARHLNLL